ncbi:MULTISPECIES: alkaline phosphatase D family protein [unclassified Agarivorans]|uniref:alkaline phosphatase D family protein n=1 Tax=unclassified Agarivorans TaxID=2636026 RepID=UPI003D7E05A7
MTASLSRRDFLIMSAKGAGAAVISYGLMGCGSSQESAIPVEFTHGVASGDPLADAVILWTRVTPAYAGDITVSWEVASDEAFTQLVSNGQMVTNASRDYTVKVDVIGLEAGSRYFYRFISAGRQSPVGKTRTLVQGSPSSVKLAVMSCSNYPAGYFNVYDLAAQHQDLDAVLHLGDYIYEYPRGGYASANAEQIDRQVLPVGELFTLSDYRTRYAQYHTDLSLQKLHAQVPFICVWDDHEVANDTWREGAENHNDGEGDFEERKLGALQAYFEWLPIRPWTEGNYQEIYRSFSFGDLVDLHMLDTRVLARDKQLDYADYFDAATGSLDQTTLTSDLSDPTRTMIGSEQLQWLQDNVSASGARWQVLGQQVLMGKMHLPAAIVLGLMSVESYASLGALAQLAARANAGDPSLTADELSYLAANADKLTTEVLAQLQLPNIPYNLDAWDGYADEREAILQLFKQQSKNLVVLAGDTHNAWANDLSDASSAVVGVEFATSSVSSPGLEEYLAIDEAAVPNVEAGLVSLIDGLKYMNVNNRGFLTVTFSQTSASADWYFVDTILSTHYQPLTARQMRATTTAGQAGLTMS